VDDVMVSYLPELRGKGLDDVTVRDLLIMSAGTTYRHEDEQPWWFGPLPFNDDTRTTNFPDLRRLALSARPNGDTPGAVFEYNNFAPLLVGMVLERATRRPVSQYLQEKIWQPLGMEYGASWSLDSHDSGFEKMSMGLNARAIDFAKFETHNIGGVTDNNGNSFRFALAIRQRALGLTKKHKFISPNDDRKRRSSGKKQSQ
jgi:CubicO group peptidase (beta-lactamase class C family)